MWSRHQPAILPFIAVLVFVSLALPMRATVLRLISFDEKVENASAIILGRCTHNQSSWGPGGQRILTYSTFTVEKTLKGFPATELTIVLPGGTVGEIRQATTGVPELREGVDYIVFVRNTRSGPTVLFFNQGLYEVRKDSGGDRILIPPSLQGVVVDTQRGVAVPTEQVSTLRQFEAAVRESVQRREATHMDLVQTKKQEPTTLLGQLRRHKFLVFLALLGAVLATWMLFRR